VLTCLLVCVCVLQAPTGNQGGFKGGFNRDNRDNRDRKP
jgi:hypothetical protein